MVGYCYIYIKKNNFIVCGSCEHHKITYFFYADIFWNCIPLSVYVYVWKIHVENLVYIYYKFTIKELFKLTKRITWRHSNIILKLEKTKFSNTLKNNRQLGDQINGTKRMKQLQNNKTNIEHETACLSQLTNRGRWWCSNKKIYPPPTVA